MTKTQFHHYIPRFILRAFSDDFTLGSPNNVFIANVSTNVIKKQKNSGAMRSPSHYIKVYQVQSRTTVLTDLARAFGVMDLYRETSEEDCMKFEKSLSVLEGDSATFIRQIWSGNPLSLTRAELERMKKFLIIMMYRSESRRDQYYREEYDTRVAVSARKHASQHKIEKIRDIWFKNLQWLIKTPLDDVMKEYDRSFQLEMTEPWINLGDRKWPIHICELQEFGILAGNYVCVWEAEEGTEFILSEGGFGIWEGDKGEKFHNFFVVSPRYAIVLVNRGYMFGMTFNHLRKSYFSEKLHDNPEVVYTRDPTGMDRTPTDMFKYKTIKVPRRDVFLVNGISLDARSKHLTYMSSVSMYKSLRYYDRVKKEKFEQRHDYTVLKRALFADLNRVHRADD